MISKSKSQMNLGSSSSSATTIVAEDARVCSVPENDVMQPLEPGKYTIVGVDIDTTGRRMIDEIVQLAAYTPNDHFEQYIMPYMNLNPAARQRHQVRVISIGFYRMLKSMQTYKILKSKSEIAAIGDFLNWLEAVKARDTNSQGIVLVYHEERKFIPYMILQSIKKYNLLDRFAATVKSFANGLLLARVTLNNGNVQQLSLRRLTRILSTVHIAVVNTAPDAEATASTGNNCSAVGDGSATLQQQQQQRTMVSSTSMTPGGDNNNNVRQMNRNRKASRLNESVEKFDGNASVRARLAYEIAFKMSLHEQQEPIEADMAYDKMLQALRAFTYPIQCDLNELQAQTKNLERQNSFRPVFLNYFKTTLYHRVRAVKFRIILAENGYDLQRLNAIWCEKGKPGIVEALQIIVELKPDDKAELAELFDSFYDPSKTTIKPIVRSSNRRRNNRRGLRSRISKNNGNGSSQPSNLEQGAGGDKQSVAAPGVSTAGQSPDSTTNAGARKPLSNGQQQKLLRRRPRRNFTNQAQGAAADGAISQPPPPNVNVAIAALN